jgi:hypothetical protein
LPKSLCLAEVSRHTCHTDAAWNCPNNWPTGSWGREADFIPRQGFDTQFAACFGAGSKNFEDAIDGPVREPMANTQGNDAVHPVVFTGAGLKHRIHSKIVARGIDVLAPVQSLHHVWRSSPQAAGRWRPRCDHSDSICCRSCKGPLRSLHYIQRALRSEPRSSRRPCCLPSNDVPPRFGRAEKFSRFAHAGYPPRPAQRAFEEAYA